MIEKIEIDSPYGNFKAVMKWQEKELIMRGEKFIVTVPYYKCQGTYQEFTTDELDTFTVMALWEQYRIKYKKPYGWVPDDDYVSATQ